MQSVADQTENKFTSFNLIMKQMKKYPTVTVSNDKINFRQGQKMTFYSVGVCFNRVTINIGERTCNSNPSWQIWLMVCITVCAI